MDGREMNRRTAAVFLRLTGETEENAPLWQPLCETAAAVMEERLADVTAEQREPFSARIALATAALAAVYYRQAVLAAQPGSFTAGELRVEAQGQAEAAAAFYCSCMEALVPLTGDAGDGFRRVIP